MYKGRGSTNEKMMRGIPGRGRERARERVPEKVEREAQLIFMCLQKKLNKSREKDEGENGSLRGKKPARPAELEESIEVNKETLRSVIMISFSHSATEAKLRAKKRLQKESYVNLRASESIRVTSAMKEITPCLCVLLTNDKRRKGRCNRQAMHR